MSRSSFLTSCALVLAVASLPARPVFATTFGVLLGGQGNGNACDEPIPSSIFTLAGQQAWLNVTVPAEYLSSPMLLSGNFAPTLPSNLPPVPKGGMIFSLTLTDPGTGAERHEFPNPISVCFRIDASNGATLGPPDGFAFGRLTSVDPPVWKCEDECLIQIGPSFWCGTTDHLSLFYIGPAEYVPEPSAIVLMLASCPLLRRRKR